jgi:ATP-binding cassette subfamily B protein
VIRRSFRYKRYLIPLGISACLTAVFEALFPLLTRKIIDDVVENGSTVQIGNYLLMYLGLTFGICTCIWMFIVFAGKICTHLNHDIRTDGFKRLHELSFSYFDRRPVGWLISRLTSDCERLTDFIGWGLLDVVSIILWILDWRLALVTLGIIPVLVAVCLFFRQLLLSSSRDIRKQNSRITASFNESIMGVRTLKTLNQETANQVEFESQSSAMCQASVLNAIQSSLLSPITLTLGSVGTGLALWYGGLITLDGTMSLGTLIAFMTYAGTLFHPIQQLATLLSSSLRAQAAAERILELLETEPEIKDSPDVLRAIEDHRDSEKSKQTASGTVLSIEGMPDRIGAIEFKNVSFSYKDGKSVLKDFNLNVPAGQTVALVGPTGCGKSTLVNLLCRFYEPTSGEILIDGIDYRKRSLHWLQSNLGIVLQTPHLLNVSIHENIRYGRLNATDAEIAKAAQQVNAEKFILETEKGFQTVVGPGGNRLSTGQKQLISFARAVLATPKLFVMDEATSSIDTETEQLIQQGLEVLLRGRTSFVIAHRLSTIRSADLILVIEEGRIIEQGNHRELLALRGHYYELYTRQFTEEKETEMLAQK